MIHLKETWEPTLEDFNAFAKVSGDDNPIHVDPEFSATSAFGRTVSHGMLIYTKLWGLLRKHHPEARQVSQSTMFPAPTFTGEPVPLEVRETERDLLALQAMRVSDGTVVFRAETRIAR
jgi:acyl dehydratase